MVVRCPQHVGVNLQNSSKSKGKLHREFKLDQNRLYSRLRFHKRVRELLSELLSVFHKNPRFVDVLLFNSAEKSNNKRDCREICA